MKLKYVAIFLVLLCCLMGAASAADDVSIDAVSEDIGDFSEVEETPISDDTSSVLKDMQPHDIIYVNGSLEDNDPEEDDITGQSWENAYGDGGWGFIYALSDITDGGTIYLADDTYSKEIDNVGKSYTLVGFSIENTIFKIQIRSYSISLFIQMFNFSNTL